MEEEQSFSDKFDLLQEKAEELFKQQPSPGSSPPTEIRQLIEELKIHQAELEIQNEELKRAHLEGVANQEEHKTLQNSEETFRSLAENANDGIMIAIKGGKHVFANAMAAVISGYTVKELLKTKIDDLLPAGERKDVTERFDRRLQGQRVRSTYESVMRRKDGSIVPISITASKVLWDGEPAVMAAFRDISEQFMSARVLEESEKRYRALFEQSNDAVFLHDTKGGIIDCNQRAIEMLGYSRTQLKNMKIRELHPDVEKDHSDKAIDQSEKRGNIRFESQFQRKNGEILDVEISARLVDKTRGIIQGIVRDISDRMRREIAERARQIFLQSILDALRSHIAILDEAGTILKVNAAWRRFGDGNGLKWKKHGIGKNYFHICRSADGEDAEMAMGVVRAMVEIAEGKREVFRQEYPCHSPEEKRWFFVQISGFFDDDLPRIVVSHIEITERKKAELSLQESEERFQQLVNHIDEIFWLSNSDRSELLYISPVYEKIWGRPVRELFEDPDIWFKAIHEEDRLRVISAAGLEMDGETAREYRIVRPDGTVRWIRDRAFPIRDAAGEVHRLVGIATDITEERQLRMESEHRLQQIVHADRLASLGEVVAGVAHEINNPNSFITYNVPLLEETWEMFRPILLEHGQVLKGWKRKGLDYEELMKDMEEIIEAIRVGSDRINRVVSNRINRVVSNLKDFARLDESEEKRPVNLNDVVENTMMVVGAQLRKSVSDIHLHLAEDLPEIQGHSQKLEQVLANLLVNAGHAITHREKGVISLTTRFIQTAGMVLVEVRDNGSGMAPETVRRLFEPFFTTRRARGGTGLGLSVSYGLVKEHNGMIGVLSRPGRGSRFTLFLPVDPSNSVSLVPTVLCVDDQPSVLKLLRSQFKRFGVGQVKTTQKPERVLDFLEAHPEVDLVMSDVKMPGLDGWRLLKKIRKRFPLMPVILYSGFPDALKPDPECELRPDAVLQKPFDRKELNRVLRSVQRQWF